MAQTVSAFKRAKSGLPYKEGTVLFLRREKMFSGKFAWTALHQERSGNDKRDRKQKTAIMAGEKRKKQHKRTEIKITKTIKLKPAVIFTGGIAKGLHLCAEPGGWGGGGKTL